MCGAKGSYKQFQSSLKQQSQV